MVRVITQDTYDEVVKENIEEFDMSPEESIKEAIAQFEAQGVDLSNIIKDLVLSSGDNHLVLTTVEKLKKLCGNNEIDDALVLNELDVLKTECSKDIAHRVMAGKAGAYKLLIDLLEVKIKLHKEPNEHNIQFILKILKCLSSLMDVQPDLLDENGINLIISCLNIHNDAILMSTLRWVGVCCIKHEINRQRIFAKNIGDILKTLLDRKDNIKLLCEVLQVIRKFTLDDDIRVEFGKAHEHARELGILLLDKLTVLLREYTTPPLVSELMWSMSTLLVRHELCARADVRHELLNVLADNYDNVVVVQQACKLITALAGNDEVKRQLVNSGMVPVIVSLLRRHASNPAAAALILKCTAALSLREPTHAKQFLETGVIEAIVECLKIHPDNAQVQKNACWAIRNLVCRCREYNPKFHELGIQGLLNHTYNNFNKDFGFDIKSALRDLDCDVTFDEQWTGRGGEIEH